MDIKKNIKVVHLSTSDNGGAGSAALRLHKGLIKIGVRSVFLCLHKYSTDKDVIAFPYYYKSRIKRLLSKFSIWQTKTEKLGNQVEKLHGNYEIFTSPYSDYNLLESPLIQNADIINLHWVANFLDYGSFFGNLNKPVIWTLHDKNPILGGFHLLLDKENNPSFAKLEEQISNYKKESVHQFDKLSIVAPSKLLYEYSKKSLIFKEYQHFYIPNAVDVQIYKLIDKSLAKDFFNLPKDKKIILFLDTSSIHKGIKYLVDVIELIECDNLQFVSLGNAFTKDFEKVINLDLISDERLMSLLYAAADLLILPSLEDNLPNVMLEAMACGTPVLGFPTGGLNDVIEYGFNGILTNSQSSEELVEKINLFAKDHYNFSSLEIRDFIIENFSLEVQAIRYRNLYETILNHY